MNNDLGLDTIPAAPPAPPAVDPLARRLRPLQDKVPGTLVVHELYRSIQGEGTHAGLPCTFIRLTACHLRCTYCDTPHAFHNGQDVPLDDLVARVLDLGDHIVQLTGGEPLLHAEAFELITRLADAGRLVLVETSGALDCSPVDPRARLILDVKTPGSGEVHANHWPNLDRLRPTDEVKFVVCDRADFDWSLDIIDRHDLTRRVPILIAPAFGDLPPTDLAAWILESQRPLRLQLQLHKLLWGPSRRGV